MACALVEARIAYRFHTAGPDDGNKASAAVEGLKSDFGHAVGEVEVSEAGNFGESSLSDGCHSVGDGDCCQFIAVPEGIRSNRCHLVFGLVINNNGGNIYTAGITVGVPSDLGLLGFCVQIVVDAIDLHGFGQCHNRQQ